jgi:diguanylate cyclase (GGDEF)-like protein
MSNDPALQPDRLRPLLSLSRELLETDDALGALQLVGKALADMMHIEHAMLLVQTGEDEYIAGFDAAGTAQRCDSSHPLYAEGRACLQGGAAGGGMQAARRSPAPSGPVLAAGVPAELPTAALVVAWNGQPAGPGAAGQHHLLADIADLAVAALGKIHTRVALEQLVWEQYEQMTTSAEAHAAELAHRDAVEEQAGLQVLTDVLTGLCNRRGFFVHAEQAYKVGQRQHVPSAVIYADIDGLKYVNDELGHDVGDRLIHDAARVFQASFRTTDVVARLAGDEFVAFTLDDEQPDAVLERIARNLEAFNLMEERPYQVSLSTGIVQCDPAGDLSLSDYLGMAYLKISEHKRRRLH